MSHYYIDNDFFKTWSIDDDNDKDWGIAIPFLVR